MYIWCWFLLKTGYYISDIFCWYLRTWHLLGRFNLDNAAEPRSAVSISAVSAISCGLCLFFILKIYKRKEIDFEIFIIISRHRMRHKSCKIVVHESMKQNWFGKPAINEIWFRFIRSYQLHSSTHHLVEGFEDKLYYNTKYIYPPTHHTTITDIYPVYVSSLM